MDRATARRGRLPLSLTAAAVFVAGGATGALAWRCSASTRAVQDEHPAGPHETTSTVSAQRPDESSRSVRSTAEIVREFDGVHTPGFGLHPDEAEFDRLVKDAEEHQNRLAWELLEAHPRDHETPRLVFIRWSNLVNGMHRYDQVLEETNQVLSAPATRRLIAVAKRSRAQAAIPDFAIDDARAKEWLEAAVTADPVDVAIAGHVLEKFAELRTADPEVQRTLVKRAVAMYPPKALGERTAENWGILSVLNRLGTPLDLEFEDALGRGPWRFEPGHPLVVHIWCAGRWDLKTTEHDPDVDDISRALPVLADAGVQVVAVERFGRESGRIDALEAARARGITWPYAIEPPRSNLEQFQAGGYSSFLWVDADGRVGAWCRRLGPLLERAGVNSR